MMKKMMIVMVVLAFCGASLLSMTSCAKKGTVVEKPAAPTQPAVQPAKPAPPAVTPTPDDEKERLAREQRERQLRMEIQAFEAGNIYFDFDKSELKPEARAILDKKASWLKAHPDFSVRVEGHCDERGTNEYNLALGERRANAAMKYLNALGISSSRISTVSYGEERPVDSGHNEAAWAKNRRDEFMLSK